MKLLLIILGSTVRYTCIFLYMYSHMFVLSSTFHEVKYPDPLIITVRKECKLSIYIPKRKEERKQNFFFNLYDCAE